MLLNGLLDIAMGTIFGKCCHLSDQGENRIVGESTGQTVENGTDNPAFETLSEGAGVNEEGVSHVKPPIPPRAKSLPSRSMDRGQLPGASVDNSSNTGKKALGYKYARLVSASDRADKMTHDCQFRTHFKTLSKAVLYGQVRDVESLIESGADMNDIDEDGETALIKAALLGKDGFVKLLLKSGADVKGEDIYGDTALMTAINKNHHKCVDLLLQAENNVKVYLSDDDTVVISVADPQGDDVNIDGRHYSTALFISALNGQEDCIRVLLDAGADVNVKDLFNGDTALIKSTLVRNVGCVSLLLQAGVDVNAQNEFGTTALMLAAENKDSKEIVELLLGAGANVNINDTNSNTALILSAKSSNYEYIDILVQAGAHVNRVNSEESTVIDYLINDYNINTAKNAEADTSGQLHKCIKFLVHTGADVKSQDFNECIMTSRKLRNTLKHLCREVIRNHLLSNWPNSNLLVSVPQTNLSSLLQSYVLYENTVDS